MFSWQVNLALIVIFLLFFTFSKKFRKFILISTSIVFLLSVLYYFYWPLLFPSPAAAASEPVTLLLSQKPSYNPSDYPLNNTYCEVNESYGSQILQWCGLITYYAKLNGLDPNLIAAVMTIESGGNPEACSPEGHMIINGIEICGSRSGAIGLMQIMPSDGIAGTHKCGCFYNRPPALELLNPEVSIAYGADMLRARNAATNPHSALKGYGGNEYYADKVLSVYYSHQLSNP